MIPPEVLSLVATIVGVVVGTIVGSKLMKRELKKEIRGFLKNELPHLLESQELEFQVRKLAQILFQEALSVLTEEPEGGEENPTGKNSEKNR